MNRISDVEPVLRAYLAENGDRAPDRVLLDVAGRIRLQPQRREWRLQRRPLMHTSVKVAAGVAAAIVVAVVVIWSAAWTPTVGPRPTASVVASASTRPSPEARQPANAAPLGDADLARIVVNGANAPERLTSVRELLGEEALRATALLPSDQPGIAGALLTGLALARDDDPYQSEHTLAPMATAFRQTYGQYGSLGIVFTTKLDADRAFAAAAATLQSPSGWGVQPEPDDRFSSDAFAPTSDWVPADGARYYAGSEYGRPILRVYLWRVENVLLMAVDLHVYDLPDVLQSMVERMDAEARRLASG